MMATSSKLLQEKEIVVEFQDVSYRVGKSNLLFKINLSIPKGELLVLLSYFAVPVFLTQKAISKRSASRGARAKILIEYGV